jgi:DNA polymerase III delta prime subunit
MSAIMSLGEYIRKDSLHHAYLIEGEYNLLLPGMLTFLAAELGIAHESNSNITKESHELFTVDDARALRERQMQRASEEGKKLFVVGVRFFTREAENALLKIFEEPTPDTHFFLIVPSADMLLPTLRSRLSIIRSLENKASRDSLMLRGNEFLRLTKPERLQFIADMLEEYEDDAKHEFLKGEALKLLDGIEIALHGSLGGSAPTIEQQTALKELLKCKSFMRDRGASTKMLLEHIALILP